jgi:hypothetical protein
MKYWPEFLGVMLGSTLTLTFAYLIRRYVYRLANWYVRKVRG